MCVPFFIFLKPIGVGVPMSNGQGQLEEFFKKIHQLNLINRIGIDAVDQPLIFMLGCL